MTAESTQAGAAQGGVELLPITAVDRAEAERLLLVADEMPEFGGALPPLAGGPPYGPSLLIRSRSTGVSIGAITIVEMTGYPGVASMSIYMLPGGRAMGRATGQAYVPAVDFAFACGARVIHHEVLAFNQPMLALLHHLEVPEVARLRRHGYAAGRLWDVIVFAFDSATWEAMHARRPRLSRILRTGTDPAR